MSEFLGEVHPLAARWPMMPDDEIAALAESIAADGLSHPLVLDDQGRLVDGRNRLEACRIAGVSPKYLTPRGLDTEEAVRSYIGRVNAQRRNVSTGQKAMAVADDLAAQGKRKNGRWARGTVHNPDSGISADKTWRNLLNLAGLVLDWRPDLTDDVIAGLITLNAAAEQAEAARDVQARAEAEERRQAAQLADLQEHRPDLAALVEAGDLPLEDALTIRDKETEAEREAQRYDEERRRQQATEFAKSLIRLGILTVTESRDRLRHEWDPALSRVNPEEVTPQHMRAVAAGLRQLADEWTMP